MVDFVFQKSIKQIPEKKLEVTAMLKISKLKRGVGVLDTRAPSAESWQMNNDIYYIIRMIMNDLYKSYSC